MITNFLILAFIFLNILDPCPAPIEIRETDSLLYGSCPPVTKRRRTVSNPQCFVSEYGIDLGSQCSSEPQSDRIKLNDLTTKQLDGIESVSGIDNEADLVLSRAGVFDWRQQPTDQLTVCERHYNILGRRFVTKRATVSRSGQKRMVCEAPRIEEMGSRHPAAICDDHYEYLQDLVVAHRREMKQYPLRNDPPHPFTAASYTTDGLRHLLQVHPSCTINSETVDNEDAYFVPVLDSGSEDSPLRSQIRKLANEAKIANFFLFQFVAIKITHVYAIFPNNVILFIS